MNDLNIESRITTINNLGLDWVQHDKTGNREISRVLIDGKEFVPSSRFFRSFYTRFGVNKKMFKLFTPGEVLQRLIDMGQDRQPFRVTVESNSKTPGPAKLLGVTSVDKSVLGIDQIERILSKYQGSDIRYDNGVISSTHVPRSGNGDFSLSGDVFQNRYMLDIPVDGYGNPRLHLSLLRLICTNGMVGFDRAFRSDIQIGNDVRHALVRALESFDNGEGYAALRSRFESAQKSVASVQEAFGLYEIICKTHYKESSKLGDQTDKGKFLEIMRRYKACVGDLSEMYGMANVNNVSPKKQRVMPTKASMYDLLNFATEISSHHANVSSSRSINSWVGSVLTDEYDLEGTAPVAGQFTDLFIAG